MRGYWKYISTLLINPTALYYNMVYFLLLHLASIAGLVLILVTQTWRGEDRSLSFATYLISQNLQKGNEAPQESYSYLASFYSSVPNFICLFHPFIFREWSEMIQYWCKTGLESFIHCENFIFKALYQCRYVSFGIFHIVFYEQVSEVGTKSNDFLWNDIKVFPPCLAIHLKSVCLYGDQKYLFLFFHIYENSQEVLAK